MKARGSEALGDELAEFDELIAPRPNHLAIRPASDDAIEVREAQTGNTFPGDFRAFLKEHNDRGLLGGLLVGGHGAYKRLGQVIDVYSSPLYSVASVFDTWVDDWRIMPSGAKKWVPHLVQIIGGFGGVFAYDFAFDEEQPVVVFVDDSWDEGDSDAFAGIEYIANSFSGALSCRHVFERNGLPREGLDELQHAAWLKHRDLMLGAS